MNGDRPKAWGWLFPLAAVLVVALLIGACTAGPEKVSKDSPSASARDGAVQLELRYLLLPDDVAKAALDDVDEHRAEVISPQGKQEPIDGYLLNDMQVDRLIRAAKASDAAAILAARRRIVLPGQAVRIEAVRRAKHPQAYKGTNDEPRPIVATSPQRITFYGGGEATEDRRYVDLHFRTGVTTATGPMERVEPYPGSSPDQRDFVEHPRTAHWETAGRATVPDQATLLLVGDRIEGSVNPRGKTAQTKQVGQQRRVFLLVRPSIIIHQPARPHPRAST